MQKAGYAFHSLRPQVVVRNIFVFVRERDALVLQPCVRHDIEYLTAIRPDNTARLRIDLSTARKQVCSSVRLLENVANSGAVAHRRVALNHGLERCLSQQLDNLVRGRAQALRQVGWSDRLLKTLAHLSSVFMQTQSDIAGGVIFGKRRLHHRRNVVREVAYAQDDALIREARPTHEQAEVT